MLSELRLAHEEIRDLRMDSDGEWPVRRHLKMNGSRLFIEDQSWKRGAVLITRLLDKRGYLLFHAKRICDNC